MGFNRNVNGGERVRRRDYYRSHEYLLLSSGKKYHLISYTDYIDF